jgi:hypothetical protein
MKDKNEPMQIFSVVEKGHKVVDVTKAIRKGVPASDATVTKNGYSFVPPPYNMEYLKELYDFNSTHKFCIFLKTNLCAGLGYRLKDKIPKSVAALRTLCNRGCCVWKKCCTISHSSKRNFGCARWRHRKGQELSSANQKWQNDSISKI